VQLAHLALLILDELLQHHVAPRRALLRTAHGLSAYTPRALQWARADLKNLQPTQHFMLGLCRDFICLMLGLCCDYGCMLRLWVYAATVGLCCDYGFMLRR
jgi:hypothetical protein